MISPKKTCKIALIGFRLSGGGAEKVMANLSVFFHSRNIEVHTITVLDEVSYTYSGELLNLGLLKDEKNGFLNKFKRMYVLKKYLNQHNFDFIIDLRPRTKTLQEIIIARFIYKAKTILTIHSFLIDYYMPKSVWLSKLIYDKCYATITVGDEIKELVESKYGLKNVTTIHNPIYLEEVEVKCKESFSIDYKYIIAIGQYEDSIKQFDKLICSYANSILSKKKIHLVILGNGNKEILETVAKNNDVFEFVHLMGFQENPYKYLKKALFLVLSSANEGFSNVILESLACHTPVIAFDCKVGPSEMIFHRNNGLLVENQNTEKLTEAMNLFVEDELLYLFCKENAFESVKRFSLENIGNLWLSLMKIS